MTKLTTHSETANREWATSFPFIELFASQLYRRVFSCQMGNVRCPEHTIHFLRFDYSQYISKVLELLDIKRETIDFSRYETYNPYD